MARAGDVVVLYQTALLHPESPPAAGVQGTRSAVAQMGPQLLWLSRETCVSSHGAPIDIHLHKH